MARRTYRPAAQGVINARLSSLLTWWEMNRERLNDGGKLMENFEFEDALDGASAAIVADLEAMGVAFEEEPAQPGGLEVHRERRRMVPGNRPS